jgi:cytochrome P450
MSEQLQTRNGDYDPFEAFDDVIGGDIRDPYPDLAQKRRTTPVWEGSLMGAEMLPEGMDLAPGWTAFRFEDCSRILRSAKTFSSTGYDSTIGLVMGHMILGMDDPEHRIHRNLVANAFREKSLARWEQELIGPICNELIDRFARRGNAELVRELTFEFPVRVIARLLGLPEEDFAQFQRWSIELIGLGADIDRGLAASQSLKDYFGQVVTERRRSPRQDVISDLVTADIDGEKLTDEAINSFLLLLLPAGADQLAAVQRDRSLLDQAIEEGLRLEPPLLMINRTATTEVELSGVTIPAGGDVTTCLGSANHDEERWENPDSFDIFRAPQQHLAFAFGPHMCLGMHLARLETRVVVNAVLDRLSGLRLDPDGDDPHIRGLIFRSPTSVPVLFDT